MRKFEWFSDKKNTVIPNIVTRKINDRLCLLNQKSSSENKVMTLKLALRFLAGGLIYLGANLYMFHTYWYHISISVLSSAVFTYILYERHFEKAESKIRDNLPGTYRKLAHYYKHYNGNVIPTLEAVELHGPPETRIYITKIKDALSGKDRERAIADLQAKLPFTWLKVLCTLLLSAAKDGGIDGSLDKEKQEDIVGNILSKLTWTLNFINLQQGHNDAELKQYESFVLIAPFAIIPASRIFNDMLMKHIDGPNVYDGIKAQSIAVAILIVSNLSVVFINWMRKIEN